MKNFIAKKLGLATSEEIQALTNSTIEATKKCIEAEEKMELYSEGFDELQKNMRILYSEISSDLKRVDKKFKQIKPILKVEDEEAVKFIKGILSRHDRNITNQSTDIQIKFNELKLLEESAAVAVEQAEAASLKINNVLNGLGLQDGTLGPAELKAIRKTFNESVVEYKESKVS